MSRFWSLLPIASLYSSAFETSSRINKNNLKRRHAWHTERSVALTLFNSRSPYSLQDALLFSLPQTFRGLPPPSPTAPLLQDLTEKLGENLFSYRGLKARAACYRPPKAPPLAGQRAQGMLCHHTCDVRAHCRVLITLIINVLLFCQRAPGATEFPFN